MNFLGLNIVFIYIQYSVGIFSYVILVNSPEVLRRNQGE